MFTRRNLIKSAALLAALPGSSRLLAADAKLISKAIPSSGQQLPVIGIGTNRYGVGDDQQAMEPLKATLARFAELGGRMIDTAPGYRNSETVLGKLISELQLKDQFFIATKCDLSGGDATRSQTQSSEAKLQSGKLDLISVHSIRNWREQLKVLQKLKAEEKIRYIGITTSRGRQFDDVENIMLNNELDFVQLNYSLGDREAEKRLLKIAADKGIAVVTNLVFGRGRLFSAVEGHAIPEWAKDFDAQSWGQVFLKYVISHPAVNCAIPGTTKVKHLVDNMSAALGRLPDSKQRGEIERYFSSL